MHAVSTNQVANILHFNNSDPHKAKYQSLIKKHENICLEHFENPKTLIEHSNDTDDIYEDIEEFNPNKDRKLLIAFDEMIADILSNIKIQQIVRELFIRDRKINISLVFYYTILSCCTKNYMIQFYTLLHFANFKRARASINRI